MQRPDVNSIVHTAGAKGLVAGLPRAENEAVEPFEVVPSSYEGDERSLRQLRWILVVEKEVGI